MWCGVFSAYVRKRKMRSRLYWRPPRCYRWRATPRAKKNRSSRNWCASTRDSRRASQSTTLFSTWPSSSSRISPRSALQCIVHYNVVTKFNTFSEKLRFASNERILNTNFYLLHIKVPLILRQQLDVCSTFLQYSLLRCYYLVLTINQLHIKNTNRSFRYAHPIFGTQTSSPLSSALFSRSVTSIFTLFSWCHFMLFHLHLSDYQLLLHPFIQNSKLTCFTNHIRLNLFLYPPDSFHGFLDLHYRFYFFSFTFNFLFRPRVADYKLAARQLLSVKLNIIVLTL